MIRVECPAVCQLDAVRVARVGHVAARAVPVVPVIADPVARVAPAFHAARATTAHVLLAARVDPVARVAPSCVRLR